MKTVIITNIILVLTIYSSLIFGEEAKSYVTDSEISTEIGERAKVYNTMMGAMLDNIPHAQTVKASEVLGKDESKLPKCATGLNGDDCFKKKQILVVGFDYFDYGKDREPIKKTSLGDIKGVLGNLFPYYDDDKRVLEIQGYGEGEIVKKTAQDFLTEGIAKKFEEKLSTIMFIEGQNVHQQHTGGDIDTGLFLPRDKSCLGVIDDSADKDSYCDSRMVKSADLNKLLLKNGDIYLFNGTDQYGELAKDFLDASGFLEVQSFGETPSADPKYEIVLSEYLTETKVPTKSLLPAFLKTITDSSCDLDKDGNLQVTLNEAAIEMFSKDGFSVQGMEGEVAVLPVPYAWESDVLAVDIASGEGNQGSVLFNSDTAKAARAKYGKEYQETKNSLDYSVVINLDSEVCNKDAKKGTIPEAPEMTDIATYVPQSE